MSEFWHLTGSKHHLMVDAHGIPLAMTLTGGNRNDVTQLLPLLDAVPPIRGLGGGPGARLASCSPTAATTSTSTDDCSANAASPRASPAAASPTVGSQKRVHAHQTGTSSAGPNQSLIHRGGPGQGNGTSEADDSLQEGTAEDAVRVTAAYEIAEFRQRRVEILDRVAVEGGHLAPVGPLAERGECSL
jgi:hypothetical protein